jgi:hypothetical protein
VHVSARALGEPVTDRRSFVGCVVVHDDVNVEVGRHVAPDLIQEFAELARAVAGHALADDGARFHIECREQRCRSVPLIVVRASLGLSGPHRQQGLRAVERLHLAFLIDTQHNCAFGRRQVCETRSWLPDCRCRADRTLCGRAWAYRRAADADVSAHEIIALLGHRLCYLDETQLKQKQLARKMACNFFRRGPKAKQQERSKSAPFQRLLRQLLLGSLRLARSATPYKS